MHGFQEWINSVTAIPDVGPPHGIPSNIGYIGDATFTCVVPVIRPRLTGTMVDYTNKINSYMKVISINALDQILKTAISVTGFLR